MPGKLVTTWSGVRVPPGEPDFRKATFHPRSGFSLLIGSVRKGKHIKGFSVARDQTTIFPKTVREYEIKNASLFLHFLLFVKAGSLLGEFEKPNSLFQVRAISILMFFDLPENFSLLRTPIAIFAVKEFLGNLTVELVDVHAINAIL